MTRLHKFQEQEVLQHGLSDDAPQKAHDLLLLWNKLAQSGQIPTRKEFTPENLAPWLQDISIYEYHPQKDDFQILLEGENIVALTGEDWRGAFAREVDCHFSTSLHAALSAARSTGAPQIHELQIFQKEWCSGVRLLLPVLRQIEGQKDVCQIFLAIFPIRDLMS
ncbi:MAG: PAS domain-containing protein [Rhodospirillales bacterium]|nr:PAS domain-containing protein [Rhodospirillales bacterium]